MSLIALGALSLAGGAELNRNARQSEAAIAAELLGTIGEQSGCSKYAAAWLDRSTQQLVARCAGTPERAHEIANASGASPRFVVDVVAANSGLGKKPLARRTKESSAVLAYRLATAARQKNNRITGPLVVYSEARQNESAQESVDSHNPISQTTFVFEF